MEIGERIRSARLERGLTQKQLGDLCDMADSAIRRYESGRGNPTQSTIQRIASALGVEPWKLMGFDGSIRVHPPGTDLLPTEFNEFERFIESMGYYTRYDKDGGNYRLHKGKASVTITPAELKALVRTSRATVTALVQDLMDNTTPAAKPPEGPENGG